MPGIRLQEAFARQGDSCHDLGAPFTAALLEFGAADVAAGGPVADLLVDFDPAPQDDTVALRFAGAVHRLVLDGRAPALAAHYPSVGGDADATAAWPLVLAAVSEHEIAVRDIVSRPPQTNEVGRSAALLGGLAHLLERSDLPIRLVEIGASAGLNLRADHFAVTEDGVLRMGPAASPVVLANGWRGASPPRPIEVEIIERRGCDPHPIDTATADGALTLTQYVWPEQVVRLARLRGALAIAAAVPATIEQQTAANFLLDLAPRNGSWLVLWHSVMWQYLGSAEKALVRARVDAIAAQATPSAPFAHVALEPDGGHHDDGFPVTLRVAPDVGFGVHRMLIGRAAPHGIPVTWSEEWTRCDDLDRQSPPAE